MRDAPAARSGASGASRRVRWVAAGISVATHAIVILTYPRLTPGHLPQRASSPILVPAAADGAMEVVRLREPPASAPTATPPPRVETSPEQEDAEPMEEEAPPVVRVETEAPARDRRTAAERLRPFMNNREVWRPIDPELLDLSLEDRARFEMAAVLDLWIDSITTAEAARVAAMDWTYRDAKGGRWGFSPGKIHLGDLTLPLPFNFGPNPSRINELRERDWEWMELRRGAVAAAVEQSLKDRGRAIRERVDAERAAARGDSARHPPPRR